MKTHTEDGWIYISSLTECGWNYCHLTKDAWNYENTYRRWLDIYIVTNRAWLELL